MGQFITRQKKINCPIVPHPFFNCPNVPVCQCPNVPHSVSFIKIWCHQQTIWRRHWTNNLHCRIYSNTYPVIITHLMSKLQWIYTTRTIYEKTSFWGKKIHTDLLLSRQLQTHHIFSWCTHVMWSAENVKKVSDWLKINKNKKVSQLTRRPNVPPSPLHGHQIINMYSPNHSDSIWY